MIGLLIDTELGVFMFWLWRMRIEYKRYTRMGHGPVVMWTK